MRTYYQITSELYQEHIIPVLNAKQYDSGRGVRITLTDCGAVVVPEATEQLRLYCKKEDGTVSYLPGTLSGSVIVVDFTNTLLAVAGTVECELQVGAGTDMVSTPVFRIRVLASNRDDSAVESTDEFTALETALATVQQYDTRIQTNTDDIAALDTRMDTAETDIDALETIAAGLGAAATKGVANNLTTETAGTDVLDAAQGKALGDRLTTAEGDITTLNDGYTNITRRTDGTITLTTGYSYSGDHSSILSKINGVVMASVSVQPPSNTLPSGWQTIMTLPTGYRPIANISVPVAIYGGANAYTTSARATINTDGKVNVFAGVSQMTGVVRIQFNATFPTA